MLSRVFTIAILMLFSNINLFSQTSFILIQNDAVRNHKKAFKDGLKIVTNLDIDKIPSIYAPGYNTTDSVVVIDINDLTNKFPQAVKHVSKNTFDVKYELLVPVLINAVQRLNKRQIELEDKVAALNTTIANQEIIMNDKIKDMLYKIELLNNEIESFRSNFLRKN